jgi:hypothetical protein
MKKSTIIWIIVGVLGFILAVFAISTLYPHHVVNQVSVVEYGTPNYRPKTA